MLKNETTISRERETHKKNWKYRARGQEPTLAEGISLTLLEQPALAPLLRPCRGEMARAEGLWCESGSGLRHSGLGSLLIVLLEVQNLRGACARQPHYVLKSINISSFNYTLYVT